MIENLGRLSLMVELVVPERSGATTWVERTTFHTIECTQEVAVQTTKQVRDLNPQFNIIATWDGPSVL